MSTEAHHDAPAQHGGAQAAQVTTNAPPGDEDFPDPDEDDLDDLDDMLDEFSATRIDAKAAPTSTAKKPDVPLDERGAEPSMEDFSAQLQKEMATLMGEANESPEMKQQFETMIKELGGTAEVVAERSAAGGSTSDSKSKGGDDAFQETIRKTMERMQASGDQASAAATSSDSDDLLAQMLKGMQGGGSEEDFSKMLLGMMEQLTNKEILYEPMKELHDKFPRWMEKNQGTTPEKDLSRFKEQQRLVEEIVSRFETKGYSDENPEDREFIVERMQQMQAAGSPPSDLVGDMQDAQAALGDMEAGCPQQ